MEKLIEAVIRLAEAAGIRAVKAFPAGAMPALTQPCTAVGLLKAKGAGRAVYGYLGVEAQADGSWTPLYGRRLEAVLMAAHGFVGLRDHGHDLIAILYQSTKGSHGKLRRSHEYDL